MELKGYIGKRITVHLRNGNSYEGILRKLTLKDYIRAPMQRFLEGQYAVLKTGLPVELEYNTHTTFEEEDVMSVIL